LFSPSDKLSLSFVKYSPPPSAHSDTRQKPEAQSPEKKQKIHRFTLVLPCRKVSHLNYPSLSGSRECNRSFPLTLSLSAAGIEGP
jgi:hypothetical protein